MTKQSSQQSPTSPKLSGIPKRTFCESSPREMLGTRAAGSLFPSKQRSNCKFLACVKKNRKVGCQRRTHKPRWPWAACRERGQWAPRLSRAGKLRYLPAPPAVSQVWQAQLANPLVCMQTLGLPGCFRMVVPILFAPLEGQDTRFSSEISGEA